MMYSDPVSDEPCLETTPSVVLQSRYVSVQHLLQQYISATAGARGRYSAHDRTYETTSISETKYALWNLEVDALWRTIPREPLSIPNSGIHGQLFTYCHRKKKSTAVIEALGPRRGAISNAARSKRYEYIYKFRRLHRHRHGAVCAKQRSSDSSLASHARLRVGRAFGCSGTLHLPKGPWFESGSLEDFFRNLRISGSARNHCLGKSFSESGLCSN